MFDNFEELRENCLNCRRCGLCETRTNVVVGVGNPRSKVMFIGEGPGENEDLQGEPFVGRGGQLLDKMLAAVDLDRKTNVYIANIVKCRPPKNRDPLPEEQEACIGWLRNPNQKPAAFEDFLKLREKIDELRLDVAKTYDNAPE